MISIAIYDIISQELWEIAHNLSLKIISLGSHLDKHIKEFYLQE